MILQSIETKRAEILDGRYVQKPRTGPVWWSRCRCKSGKSVCRRPRLHGENQEAAGVSWSGEDDSETGLLSRCFESGIECYGIGDWCSHYNLIFFHQRSAICLRSFITSSNFLILLFWFSLNHKLHYLSLFPYWSRLLWQTQLYCSKLSLGKEYSKVEGLAFNGAVFVGALIFFSSSRSYYVKRYTTTW